MSGLVDDAESSRYGCDHGGFLLTFACCGWKKMNWYWIEAAMVDQEAADNAVLRVTGLRDPLC
jgi:hypothetical protein